MKCNLKCNETFRIVNKIKNGKDEKRQVSWGNEKREREREVKKK